MCHPFELEISELESIKLKIQKITDKEAEKLAGGLSVATSLRTGEEGGSTLPEVPLVLCGEGGDDVITMALGLGEDGGEIIFI